MKTLALFAFLSTFAAAAETVAHRLPVTSSVFPQGARPGDRVEAEVLGEYLDRAIAIVPFDKQISGEILECSPTRMRIRISVSETASFGPHYFRVVTPRGASGPLLFRVGDLKRARDAEPNSSIKQAQPVEAPVTIDGRLNQDGDYDFYRFQARAGETWVFDLRAARNGNGLDAGLILMDLNGVKLAHDEDHFIWDPFFTHTFKAAGEYIAVIQPTHRSNDPNFGYELEIRQAPHLQTIAPISVQPGSVTEAVIHGAGFVGTNPRLVANYGISAELVSIGELSATVRLHVPKDASEGVHELTFATDAGRSNPVRFLVDATPIHTSGELKPPVAVTGVIRYREPERFQLRAAKDQTLVFEVRSNRFGSPTDPLIRIIDSKGKLVANNDDFTFAVADFYNKDPRLMHTFKEEGEYTVELRNLVNTSGENFPYQLRITPPYPHFELAMATERPYVYPGKEAKLKVTAARRDGHKGPIPVELRGLPQGIAAEPAVIAEDKNEVEIVLKAEPSLKPGAAANVAIHAGGVQAWRPVRIGSGGGEGATFARVESVLLTVAEKPSFSLEAAVTTVNLPRGGSAALPVMIRREADFKGAIEFRLENLPQGITMSPAVAAAESDRIEVRIHATAAAAAGRSPRIVVLGVAGAEQQEAPRISIQVD